MAYRERPMLMSGPMVRATLRDESPKTVTRRVVRPQPPKENGMVNAAYCGDPNLWLPTGSFTDGFHSRKYKCPYGVPGDVLWVRETWAYGDSESGSYSAVYRNQPDIIFRATDWNEHDGAWTPSIFMPRAACRIFLRVTDVRVEQVQEIRGNNASAMAEGATERASERGRYWSMDWSRVGTKSKWSMHGGDTLTVSDVGLSAPWCAFVNYWDQLNAKRGFSWKSNPWVWVVAYERISKEEVERLRRAA